MAQTIELDEETRQLIEDTNKNIAQLTQTVGNFFNSLFRTPSGRISNVNYTVLTPDLQDYIRRQTEAQEAVVIQLTEIKAVMTELLTYVTQVKAVLTEP